MLCQKECILKNLENRKLTLGIFLDLTKAFDCINHSILLIKLSKYGIRGKALEVMASYLGARKQFVSLKRGMSGTLDIRSGVPQGSILGPLLFIFYINDIVCTDHDAQFVVYADDTTVLISALQESDLVFKGNAVLDKIRVWTERNCLRVNISKTKAVIFKPKNKTLTTISPLTFGEHELEFVHSVKSLGVIFSQDMSWNDHCKQLTTKLCKVSGILSKYRQFFPANVKLILYNSLFFSQLCYCTLVWGTTTKTNTRKLDLIQKRVLRIIQGLNFGDHAEHLFAQFQILRVSALYEYRLIQLYKRMVKADSPYIDIFCLEHTESPYGLRRLSPFVVPFCRTGYGCQSFTYQLPTILNHLASTNVNALTLSDASIKKTLIY